MKRPLEREPTSTVQPGPGPRPKNLQKSGSAADLSSAGASAATRESAASLWGCREVQPSPQSSQDSEGTARRGCESEGEGSGGRMSTRAGQSTLDIRGQPAWARVAAGVEDALAVLLRGEGSELVKTEQRVECCSASEEMGKLYIRLKSAETQAGIPEATLQSGALGQEKTRLQMYALAASQEGRGLGNFWTLRLQEGPTSSHLDTMLAAKQLVSLLGGVIPSELQPATEVTKRGNWLAYSPQGVAATDLVLHVGDSLWATGFTKSAAALSPVYLSLPLKTDSQEQAGEVAHRTWVVQQDQEALAGMEAVLQAVRADALGAPLADGFQPWEEADGQAAVFSHQNLLGVATQVVQRPGELLALQRQGHCSYGSGGVYLSWNVARGPEWPAAALREGRIRSRAVRQAAKGRHDPWFSCQEDRQPVQPAGLHILRLLFAAACSVDKAHVDIVEGLQEHFLPICVAECHAQASSSLPQLNARQGILEAADELRCSCCAGEFVFSYVALVKRKGERGGRICWQCWEQRESIGLQQHCRNARKCVIIDRTDLLRLIAAIDATRPLKRAKLSL